MLTFKRIIYIVILVISVQPLWATEPTVTLTSALTLAQGDHAPFWLTANRHGIGSLALGQAYLRASAIGADDQSRRFGYEYGVDLLGGWNLERPVLAQQYYAGVRYGCWSLTLGAKEHASQGKNALLSTGGLTWSGNARPIPQARFGIYEYTDVPFLDGWAQVKGFFSYGRATDDRFLKQFASRTLGNTYLLGTIIHEKSAFLKLGKASCFPLTFEAGLELDSQFGGAKYRHVADGETLLYTMPTHAMDYVRAFLCLPGGSDATECDQINIAGNVLGSWHFAFNYDAPADWHFRTYYEHYFEDRSGMTGISHPYLIDGRQVLYIYPWHDGLWGLETTFPANPVLGTLVFEFVNTRYMSGPMQTESMTSIHQRVFGLDGYYNHSEYNSWSHHGFSIGTPLAYSPLYNEDGSLHIPYNRFRTLHLGLGNTLSAAWQWRFLLTHSKEWGFYTTPLPTPAHQWHSLLEVTWTPTSRPSWTGWSFVASAALDRGPLTGPSTGFQLGLSKILF